MPGLYNTSHLSTSSGHSLVALELGHFAIILHSMPGCLLLLMLIADADAHDAILSTATFETFGSQKSCQTARTAFQIHFRLSEE